MVDASYHHRLCDASLSRFVSPLSPPPTAACVSRRRLVRVHARAAACHQRGRPSRQAKRRLTTRQRTNDTRGRTRRQREEQERRGQERNRGTRDKCDREGHATTYPHIYRPQGRARGHGAGTYLHACPLVPACVRAVGWQRRRQRRRDMCRPSQAAARLSTAPNAERHNHLLVQHHLCLLSRIAFVPRQLIGSPLVYLLLVTPPPRTPPVPVRCGVSFVCHTHRRRCLCPSARRRCRPMGSLRWHTCSRQPSCPR